MSECTQMENKVNRDEIETKLGEKINTVTLIKETSSLLTLR